MQITNFKLPQTKLCVVVWYRNNQKHEELIETPATNNQLTNLMLAKHVGRSEIRAIKPVDPAGLISTRI